MVPKINKDHKTEIAICIKYIWENLACLVC